MRRCVGTIGRSGDASYRPVRLEQVTISRRHRAEFRANKDGGKYELKTYILSGR